MAMKMHEGMTNTSPPAVDASHKVKGGSVDDMPTRTGPAMNEKAPGPRTA